MNNNLFSIFFKLFLTFGLFYSAPVYAYQYSYSQQNYDNNYSQESHNYYRDTHYSYKFDNNRNKNGNFLEAYELGLQDGTIVQAYVSGSAEGV